VAAIFLSGPTIISGFVQGFGWNHLDGFHFFPGLPLASSRFFQVLGFKAVFRFRMEVSLLWSFGYRITGFSLDIRIYWLVFTGCRTNVLQDFGFQLDCQGLDSQVFRTLDLRDSKDFRIVGFSKFLDLVSVDLRILVSDFDTGFGHLVFVDLVVLVC
jgi:hypothetical protein